MFFSYYKWACTQCRKVFGARADEGVIDETTDVLDWLYDVWIVHTPSTPGSLLSYRGSDYEPVDADLSPCQPENKKKDFVQWLISTNYEGRWRSTENYCSLTREPPQVINRF